MVWENEGGARRVLEPTFFYMPHCEKELYDALLRANWGGSRRSRGGNGRCASGLPLVAVLGNSFRQYVERYDNLDICHT